MEYTIIRGPRQNKKTRSINMSTEENEGYLELLPATKNLLQQPKG